MYNCEKCKNDFTIDWRKDQRLRMMQPIPRFCSRNCANSRTQGVVSNEKRRLSLSGRKKYPEGYFFTNADRRKGVENRLASNLERILLTSWNELGEKAMRTRVLAEQGGLCAECTNPQTWNSKPLKFHYDHIDGKKATEYDNRRENVRMICPNCHSQTPTYTAKNMTPAGRARCRIVGIKNFQK